MHRNKIPIDSLKVFGESLIDYAGLFPPASLNLAQAFNNYVMYLEGGYRWMLAKFIIPAKRLIELEELLKQMKFDKDIVLPLSVLGTTAEKAGDFASHFESDLRRIMDFKSKFSGRASIDVFETRLPGDLVSEGSSNDIAEVMQIVSSAFSDKLKMQISTFYETALKQNFDEKVIKVNEAISLHNRKSSGAGFKLRTGGIEPSAFPEISEIAFALSTSLAYGNKVKCTAGLHHPIRHYDEAVNSNMHGFLNVFGAGVFAYVCQLEEEEILAILNEEDPYSFHFLEEGIDIHDNFAGLEEIKEARENFMISYGSCSFDEPIEDLKTMEVL